MTDILSLDEGYSTTRLLTQEKPEIINTPEDKFETVLFLPEGENRKGEGGLRTKGYFKKSYDDKPLISIITVVFNGEKFLEETIKSVINQSYNNIEYIIIDGGSTDNTINIIKEYEDKIDYWISEKDKGIYDAMNKGIDVSNGKGLIFLNAGDYFVGNVLSNKMIVPCFLNVKYKNFFNKLVNIKIKNYKSGIPNCHQGIVFENKKIKYDVSFKIASDYDFYLRHGYKLLSIIDSDGYIYYDNEGFSQQNRNKRDLEISEIIYKNFGLFQSLKFIIKSKIKNILVRTLGK
jgi:glycosyltransferase involved in cell wall biosynthesis